MTKLKDLKFNDVREVSQLKVSVDSNVIKVEEPLEFFVSEYDFATIHKGRPDHLVFDFGNIRQAKPSPGEKQFDLNGVVKESLGIDEIERQQIEAQVAGMLKEQLDKFSEDARKKGYEEGFEKGKSDAYAQYADDAKENAEAFTKFLGSCDEVKDQIFQENEKFLVDYIVKIAESIILRELKSDADYVQRLAKEVIQSTGLKDAVIVKVNPADLARVRAIREDIDASVEELRNLSFEAVDGIEVGGIIVETEKSVIDARIETQISKVHDAVSGVRS